MLKCFIICFIKQNFFEANERDLGPKKAHFQSNQLTGLKLIYIHSFNEELKCKGLYKAKTPQFITTWYCAYLYNWIAR